METTAACFLKEDDRPGAAKGAALIDALYDSCGSKGTGKWTVKQVPATLPARNGNGHLFGRLSRCPLP